MKRILTLLFCLLCLTTNVYGGNVTELIIPPEITISDLAKMKMLLDKKLTNKEAVSLKKNIAATVGLIIGIKRTFGVFIADNDQELNCINNIDLDTILSEYNLKNHASDTVEIEVYSECLQCLNEKKQRYIRSLHEKY